MDQVGFCCESYHRDSSVLLGVGLDRPMELVVIGF